MKCLYTIYDSKSETFFPPHLFKNDGEAIRSLSDEMGNNESLLAKHPEDYSLIKLGTWEEDTGKIQLLEARQTVMDLFQLKKQ